MTAHCPNDKHAFEFVAKSVTEKAPPIGCGEMKDQTQHPLTNHHDCGSELEMAKVDIHGESPSMMIHKSQKAIFASNVAWAKKVAMTKVKLRGSAKSMATKNAGGKVSDRKILAIREQKFISKQKIQVEHALGDILVERVLQMDPTLLDKVSEED